MTSQQTSSEMFFSRSPFSNVADKESAGCWSGRPKVQEALLRLKRTLTRMADSTLDVVWANFGAGKTHTLLHLAYLLEQGPERDSSVICAVLDMPEQIRSFLDLYKRIIPALPRDRVADIIAGCPKGTVLDSLARAANVIRYGNAEEKELIAEWLSAGNPLLRDLRRCSGIGQRIEEDTAAADILAGIISALSLSRIRLVILVDEFQRMGALKDAARGRVLSCIRTVFSASPRYFSMVLSIQSMLEENALRFVPPELKTLLGRKPTISLPEMDESEAEAFVIGRFKCFRPPDYAGSPEAPFADSAIPAVIRFIHNDVGAVLSPRDILQAFGLVYGQAVDPTQAITADEALELLRDAYGPRQP